MGRPPRLLFLARQLSVGGAERQLAVLAGGLARRGWEVTVLTFYPSGALEQELVNERVQVRTLDKRGRWDVLGFARSLRNALREVQPDLVHSYLDVPNLVSALARLLFGRAPVVWGVRASDMDWRGYDRMRRLSFEATRLVARVPALIIANSHAGRRTVVGQGYPAARVVVIPNGIDTDRFQPDSARRAAVRAALGLAPNTPLLGLIGRMDPMKGHGVFLEAARTIGAQRPDARFLFVGSGDETYARSLRAQAEALGIADRLLWRAAGTDVESVYNGLDILVLASVWGEGFPNVLAEAMACGVRSVAADCGDAAMILGDLGTVAPRGDAAALAERCLALLNLSPEAQAQWARDARESIVSRFSVESLVSATAARLLSVLQSPASDANVIG